ncbi:MAG: 2'-deoxycytidine 5'-triphosphate deaminase [Candidatus Levybacteria bacterium]|nr:2'-deoxycytidine 5'-triphosphate deaminase [Candidatus Levybacteria bacterium]
MPNLFQHLPKNEILKQVQDDMWRRKIMILGPKKLLQLVKTKKLVEGLSERELTNPEGAGFDLRLGEVYKISGSAFLGETHRKTPDIETVQSYKEGEKRVIKIKPGDFFLVKTMEKINLPVELSAVIIPRTTTFRSGIFIRTGPIQPGYSGELTFGLKNEGSVTVEIEMGARFVHLMFHEIKGKGSQYRGQWQGGRVTAKKKEKQV